MSAGKEGSEPVTRWFRAVGFDKKQRLFFSPVNGGSGWSI